MAVVATTEKARKFLIGGDWRESAEKLEVRSPQGGIAGITFRAGEADIEEAIQSAIRGFEVMKKLPSYKRAEILKNIADKIREKKEDFARSITLECGKPIRDSRAEAERAVMTFTVASEEAKRIPGDAIPLDLNQASEGRIGILRRFPIGPVLGITPFNFPLNLVAHKVAPVLAAGNTMILRPSQKTPLTPLLLAEVAVQAGVPSGALSVVPCSPALGERLVADERIKAFSFTGGTEVGWKLRALAGKKKVILELGGNAAAIVDEDADIDHAAERCAAGAYYYSGQSCISLQRIYVYRSRYDEFMRKFVEQVERKKVGDPMDEATDVGPLIDEDAAKRVEQWVKEAVDGGARIVTGGKRRGAVYTPTVLEGVDPKQKISCLEAFGPAAVVGSFDSFQEAIAKVNDSTYGLQAAVFSNNLEHVFRAHQEIEVGQVIHNDSPSYRIDHMPYGGVKDSGLGREGVKYAIQELTEMRLLVVRN